MVVLFYCQIERSLKKLELLGYDGFVLCVFRVFYFSCQIEGELKKLETQVMRNCGLWV